MGCDTVKAGSASSAFASKATIHIVQKSMATNLLLGNLQIVKVGDLWADASLFDLMAYLPQLDMAKVARIRMEDQALTNERVINVSEAKLTLPKTSTENIGYIRTVDHFTSLVANAANIASTCVDFDGMEKEWKGECLDIALSNHFIEMVGAYFVAWTQQPHIGGPNVHLALFGYYDSDHLNIPKFATNFKNTNVLESGRPA